MLRHSHKIKGEADEEFFQTHDECKCCALKTEPSPIRWNMVQTSGEPTDEQTNPTVYWPAERKTIQVGVLTLTSATPQKGAECEKINFDPLVMGDGIAPTDDPILLFRSPAYAASCVKRLTGN
jgi:catalase